MLCGSVFLKTIKPQHTLTVDLPILAARETAVKTWSENDHIMVHMLYEVPQCIRTEEVVLAAARSERTKKHLEQRKRNLGYISKHNTNKENKEQQELTKINQERQIKSRNFRARRRQYNLLFGPAIWATGCRRCGVSLERILYGNPCH